MEINILNWMKRSKKKTGHAKNTEKLIKRKKLSYKTLIFINIPLNNI